MSEITAKLKFIQDTLKRLTGKNVSHNEIKDNYLKLLSNLKYKKTLMIAGSQGSGKSTLSVLIKKFFLKFYSKNVVILSIDDFYLSSFQRKQLARKFNTDLFETRGVPGTHNLKLLDEVINNLMKKKFPVYIPVFDKVTDNKKNYKRKISKVDLLILEGWCVGSKPIDIKYLKMNINDLEKKNDSNLIWRTAYNSALIDYQIIFKKFDYYIFIKFPNWEFVIDWKYKQELSLRSLKSNIRLKKKLHQFIKYYQKLSKWMSLTTPSYCNVLITLDRNQSIKKITYK
jgi:D-glycerate 3-kinase